MNEYIRVSSQATFNRFEEFLSNSLGEVEPDPNFVGHLRQRLTKKNDVEIENPKWLSAYMVIGAGLFSGVLLFWILTQVFKGVKSLVLQ